MTDLIDKEAVESKARALQRGWLVGDEATNLAVSRLRNALRDLLQRHEELAEWDDSKAVQQARELLKEANDVP